ncbi:MAG: hypothetical protein JXR12_05925 [Neptunomonas phycophila]|uniref:hypothetical protein n=1 Tax=Neptunomonas phycophila TaxID=1572645 RepID=UPI003B8CB28E
MSLLLLATDDGVIVEIEQKVVDSSEQVDYSDHPDYKTLKCIPRKDHGDPNTTICDEWEEVPKEEEQY